MPLDINQFAKYNSGVNPESALITDLISADECFIQNGEIVTRSPYNTHANGSFPLFGPLAGCEVLSAPPSILGNDFLVFKVNDGTPSSYRSIPLLFNTGDNNFQNLITVDSANPANTQSAKFKLYNGVLYISDGRSIGYKVFYDPTLGPVPQIIHQGLPPPTTLSDPVSSALSSTWPETGTYQYAVSWVQVNPYQTIESNAQTSSMAFTVSSLSTQRATITIPTAAIPGQTTSGTDDRVTKARIYRKNPSQTLYYYVGEVTVSYTSAVTFQDDGTLFQDQTRPLSFNNGRIPQGHIDMELYAGRMWYLANDNISVFFSEIDANGVSQPEAVPSFNQIAIGNSTDAFVACFTYPSFLLIVKKFSMWIISGTTKADFAVQQVARAGSFCRNMTFIHRGLLYFANNEGIFVTDLFTKATKISDQIKLEFDMANAAEQYNNWNWYLDPNTENLVFIVGTYGYVYTPNATNDTDRIVGALNGQFIGRLNGSAFTKNVKVSQDIRCVIRQSASNASLQSIGQTSFWLHPEASISCQFTLGGMVPAPGGQPRSLTNKLYRYLSFHANSALATNLTIASYKSELYPNSVITYQTYSILKELIQKVNLGRASNAMLFKFSWVQPNGGKFKFTGLRLEYEDSGQW